MVRLVLTTRRTAICRLRCPGGERPVGGALFWIVNARFLVGDRDQNRRRLIDSGRLRAAATSRNHNPCVCDPS